MNRPTYDKYPESKLTAKSDGKTSDVLIHNATSVNAQWPENISLAA